MNSTTRPPVAKFIGTLALIFIGTGAGTLLGAGQFFVLEEVVSTKMDYDTVINHDPANAEHIVSAGSSCLMHNRGAANGMASRLGSSTSLKSGTEPTGEHAPIDAAS